MSELLNTHLSSNILNLNDINNQYDSLTDSYKIYPEDYDINSKLSFNIFEKNTEYTIFNNNIG